MPYGYIVLQKAALRRGGSQRGGDALICLASGMSCSTRDCRYRIQGDAPGPGESLGPGVTPQGGVR